MSKRKEIQNMVRTNLSVSTGSYETRTETLDGNEYVVAPVVMIVEGVLNNLLYSVEEISKFPASWNGRPIPVYHPEKDGVACSCNTPEALESNTIGMLMNTSFEGAKLKSEVWVNVTKASKIAPDVLKRIQSGEALEVSTGLWHDIETLSGSFAGKPYKGIVKNIRPDHLAILPDQVGACSVGDGCGIRVNNADTKDLLERTKFLSNRALSYHTIIDLIQTKLGNELEIDSFDVWVVDLFPESVVYKTYLDGKEILVRRSYEVRDGLNENDSLILHEDVVEVKKVITYEELNNPEKEGDPQMEKEKTVDGLISAGQWGAEDRVWLLGLPEDKFTKVTANASVELVVPKAPCADCAGTVIDEPKAEEAPVTVDAYIAAAPGDVQEVLSSALRLHREKKSALVAKIAANKNNKFSKESLSKKSSEELEMIASFCVEEVTANTSEGAQNYSGAAGNFTNNNLKETPMGPIPALFETKV